MQWGVVVLGLGQVDIGFIVSLGALSRNLIWNFIILPFCHHQKNKRCLPIRRRLPEQCQGDSESWFWKWWKRRNVLLVHNRLFKQKRNLNLLFTLYMWNVNLIPSSSSAATVQAKQRRLHTLCAVCDVWPF